METGGFFSEDNGNRSTMRISVFIVVLTACFIAAYSTVKPVEIVASQQVQNETIITVNQVVQINLIERIGMVTSLLGVAFGAKYLQKKVENGVPKTNGKTE